jgi:hypothetical protein
MKNAVDNARTRSRPRKKQDSPVTPAPLAVQAPAAPLKNVGSLESGFSLLLGLLIVFAALFPRSLKQIVLLALGGGLVYRGITSNCKLYEALDVSAERGSLFGQIARKYLAHPARN